MIALLPNAPRVRLGLAVLDGAALVAAGWFAHLVRFDPGARVEKVVFLGDRPLFIAITLAVLWLLATAAEIYEPIPLRRRGELVVRVSAVAIAWAAATVMTTYFVPDWSFGRGLLSLTAVSWAVIAVALRFIVLRWIRRRPRALALLVGRDEEVRQVCLRLEQHPLSVWRPVPATAATPAEIATEARESGAEVVVLVGDPDDSGVSIQGLADLHFSGVPVVAASEIWAWLEARLPLDDLSAAAFLHQPGFGAVHWKLFNRVTRVFDVLIAGIALVLALPVLVFAALAIAMEDGFPVLYRQVRVGQFGELFLLYKLRTMHKDAEADGPTFASESDPRATRVGRLLRRLRVDELPQLANVLRGEMSMVGPRPERPEFAGVLRQEILYYMFRLAVPPGLTGWAQVSMPYARTTEEHRLRLEYDLYFIRERSVTLYILTLLRTVSATLVGTER